MVEKFHDSFFSSSENIDRSLTAEHQRRRPHLIFIIISNQLFRSKMCAFFCHFMFDFYFLHNWNLCAENDDAVVCNATIEWAGSFLIYECLAQRTSFSTKETRRVREKERERKTNDSRDGTNVTCALTFASILQPNRRRSMMDGLLACACARTQHGDNQTIVKKRRKPCDGLV